MPKDWTPPTDGSVNVLARLRNDAPLVVEKQFGNGRVVAQLTKLSTGDTPLGRWTNWSLNPVFPVLANELVAYLSAGQKNDAVQPWATIWSFACRTRSTIRPFGSSCRPTAASGRSCRSTPRSKTAS